MFNKYYEKFKGFMRENYKFLLTIIVIVCLFTFELPYVVYTPGGAIDLSDRIEVSEGFEAEGSLSMAYVSMIKGSIPFLLFSYIMPNWDIVSTKQIKPDNESLDDMIKADQISLIQAQNNALYAAFSLAGKKVEVKSQTNHLVYISEYADTDLELFDEILTMNGKAIEDLDTIREMVKTLNVGDKVTFEIMRRDKKMTKTATVYETSDGPKVGVSITSTYEYVTD
ncbi:MAG: PDZ domain-containing protein, partial [Bacilli bacterium]|nr:PDZ domain-containing protein [Bacilli bacterium]